MRSKHSTATASVTISEPVSTRALCRQRCHAHLERLTGVAQRLSEPNLTPDAADQLRDEELAVLSIEPRWQLRIELSCGGPADGFTLLVATDRRTIVEGYYWYADWGTYAEEPLTASECDLVSDLYLHGDPASFFPSDR